jgi:nitrogen-specific signal transduction histidine kinase
MAARDTWLIGEPAIERRVALAVVIVFVIAGSAWILFSDVLLYAVVQDRTVVARFETAKGWMFVGLTACLLYMVTLRNVAQLTKASRTIFAVLESIGDGVLLLGSDRTVAYANPASIGMLGIAKRDDLQGMGAPEFSRRFHVSYLDGSLVPPDQFASQRVFDEPGPIRYKAVLYPPGAPEVVISCTAAGVRPEIGRSADVVVSVMHDITATEQLDRLRDELFTSTAHAIKTPITVIKSAAQLLSAAGSAEVRRSTVMIDRQCERVQQLVENLLLLSRIRSGTLQLYPAEIDLVSVVEEIGGEVAGLSSGHAIEVRLDAHPRIRADRERIVMVLRNAIDGATRASRPGGPVTIQLARSGDDAEVAISYQPQSSNGEAGDQCPNATDFDDMGVARYVTKVIVEAHGGTLTEQADGDVTTIRIRFPAEGVV